MKFFKAIWTLSLSSAYNYVRSRNIFGSFERKMVVVELDSPFPKALKINIEKSSPEYRAISTGEYESFLIDYIKDLKIDKTSPVIWDIGAHVGYLSMILGKQFLGKGKIVSFEPNFNNVNNFKNNLSLNPELTNVTLEHSAVGAEVGELTFNLSRSKNNPTTMGGFINTALPPLELDAYKKMGFYSTIVPCTTIDDYVSKRAELQPDIIKIDVEGAELEVLKGGLQYLKVKMPVLIIEVHHIVLLYKVTNELRELGYKIILINEASASSSVCTIAATKQ